MQKSKINNTKINILVYQYLVTILAWVCSVNLAGGVLGRFEVGIAVGLMLLGLPSIVYTREATNYRSVDKLRRVLLVFYLIWYVSPYLAYVVFPELISEFYLYNESSFAGGGLFVSVYLNSIVLGSILHSDYDSDVSPAFGKNQANKTTNLVLSVLLLFLLAYLISITEQQHDASITGYLESFKDESGLRNNRFISISIMVAIVCAAILILNRQKNKLFAWSALLISVGTIVVLANINGRRQAVFRVLTITCLPLIISIQKPIKWLLLMICCFLPIFYLAALKRTGFRSDITTILSSDALSILIGETAGTAAYHSRVASLVSSGSGGGFENFTRNVHLLIPYREIFLGRLGADVLTIGHASEIVSRCDNVDSTTSAFTFGSSLIGEFFYNTGFSGVIIMVLVSWLSNRIIVMGLANPSAGVFGSIVLCYFYGVMMWFVRSSIDDVLYEVRFLIFITIISGLVKALGKLEGSHDLVNKASKPT